MAVERHSLTISLDAGAVAILANRPPGVGQSPWLANLAAQALARGEANTAAPTGRTIAKASVVLANDLFDAIAARVGGDRVVDFVRAALLAYSPSPHPPPSGGAPSIGRPSTEPALVKAVGLPMSTAAVPPSRVPSPPVPPARVPPAPPSSPRPPVAQRPADPPKAVLASQAIAPKRFTNPAPSRPVKSPMSEGRSHSSTPSVTPASLDRQLRFAALAELHPVPAARVPPVRSDDLGDLAAQAMRRIEAAARDAVLPQTSTRPRRSRWFASRTQPHPPVPRRQEPIMHDQPHESESDDDDDEAPSDTIYDVEHGTYTELTHILGAAKRGRAFPSVLAALTADEDTVHEIHSVLDGVAVGGSVRIALAVDRDYDAVGLLDDEIDACEVRVIAGLQSRGDIWSISRTHYVLPDMEEEVDEDQDDSEDSADEDDDSEDDDQDDDPDDDPDDEEEAEPDRVVSVMRLTRTS